MAYLCGGPGHGMLIPFDNNIQHAECVDRAGGRFFYRRSLVERNGAGGEPYLMFVCVSPAPNDAEIGEVAALLDQSGKRRRFKVVWEKDEE